MQHVSLWLPEMSAHPRYVSASLQISWINDHSQDQALDFNCTTEIRSQPCFWWEGWVKRIACLGLIFFKPQKALVVKSVCAWSTNWKLTFFFPLILCRIWKTSWQTSSLKNRAGSRTSNSIMAKPQLVRSQWTWWEKHHCIHCDCFCLSSL